MRIIVERDALAEAVAWVARSLPSRPVLPILSGLLLEASTGRLTLSCFDYEVSARVQVDAEVADPGTALVPGRLLAEIPGSLPPFPVEPGHDARRTGRRGEPERLAARGRRDDRVRVGRAAADHPADRGGVHQVHVQV